jgi:polysaccharide export outer membrane protein
MINISARSVLCVVSLSLLSLVSCSEVLEPVALPEMQGSIAQQEDFDIKLQPLNFEAARKLNKARYNRMVSRPGKAFSADLVAEANFLKPSFPPASPFQRYKLGVGDEVTLIQVLDTIASLSSLAGGVESDEGGAGTTLSIPGATTEVVETSGRIGTDGSLLLIGVGRLEASGRGISELRDEARNVFIRNGKAPDFQLEITGFNSQLAYITTDGNVRASNAVIPVTDQSITLREVIANVGIAFNQEVLTIVRFQRSGKTYTFTLADLLADNAPKINLKDQDHVFVNHLKYQPGKVFLLGGVTPRIIPILPEERQTLAAALFAEGGPLDTPSAQRSAVYLLRGRKPTQAYHLDAQNPASVLVADAVELRPNDIVFVAEQPLTSFNRTLGSIIPLRILLRDIQDDNFP